MELFIAPVKFSNISLLNGILKRLSSILKINIKIVNLNIDLTNCFVKEREQYFSSQIISEAMKKTGNLHGKVLILVEFDIFVPVFTYIFGEAQLNGKHSIVSLCRLHEEFYSDQTNDELLMQRTIKEILHELGHNFGLIHCKDWSCVMHSSGGIEEIDIKGDFYCSACLQKSKLFQPGETG